MSDLEKLENNESELDVTATVVDDKKELEDSLETYELNENETIDTCNEKIDVSRKTYFSLFKKHNLIQKILGGLTIVVIAASAYLIFGLNQQWSQITGGCLLGAMIVGLVVFFIITRKRLPSTGREYLRVLAKASDYYIFSNQNFTNKKLFFKKKYSIQDFAPDRVYKGIIDISSRNLIEGEYNGHSFSSGEVSLYKEGEKRYQKAILFVGKYISMNNDFHFVDRYIVNIRGDKDLDLPDDLEGLEPIINQNRFVVYGPKGSKPEKDLGKDLINNLKSIDCKHALLNVNIVFWSGHTGVYLSYDDSFIQVSIEKPIDKASYQQVKKNIDDIFAILTAK